MGAAELSLNDEGAGLEPVTTSAAASDTGSQLILANVWVAVIAFGVAAAMAMMQAISRANLELPYRSARMYYMSVTAHGVLMALVFTTFFIMALGYAVVREETEVLPRSRRRSRSSHSKRVSCTHSIRRSRRIRRSTSA
jgi:hypothetical protein